MPRPDSLRRWIAHLPEVVWAPLTSAALILLVGGLGLLFGQPWLFPSLGPTVFLQTHRPHHASARLYNTLIGHSVATFAGYAAVLVFGAQHTPPVLSTEHLSAPRVWASAVAVAATLLLQIPARASHPPGAATTLLITLGVFGLHFGAVFSLAVGVATVGVCGELLRRLRLGGRKRTPKT